MGSHNDRMGGCTALFAATVAVAQNDSKKVWLTQQSVNLVGMFLAVGTGAHMSLQFSTW